jgi:ABC-type amino acid transport system permease subunit
MPSNEERGYVLRRIMRRAIRYGVKLGLKDAFLFRAALAVTDHLGDAYPELRERRGFIAEVVRGGIQSVPQGQAEAASALGLSQSHSMRLVQLPQALRVIIPPLTNQYLNLTKNSSLAVAIGYPDVVSIANTAINQTGRAVECIALIMVVYLTTSLLTALLMNWYNARSAIQER